MAICITPNQGYGWLGEILLLILTEHLGNLRVGVKQSGGFDTRCSTSPLLERVSEDWRATSGCLFSKSTVFPIVVAGRDVQVQQRLHEQPLAHTAAGLSTATCCQRTIGRVHGCCSQIVPSIQDLHEEALVHAEDVLRHQVAFQTWHYSMFRMGPSKNANTCPARAIVSKNCQSSGECTLRRSLMAVSMESRLMELVAKGPSSMSSCM